MGDINNGGDASEKLSGRLASLEARLNSVSRAVEASGAKTDKATEKLKTEIQFVSAQLESVCMTLMKSVQKLTEEIEAIKKDGVPAKLDVDDLSSAVAAKIVIPESLNPDADEIAEKVGKVQIDYEALGYSVAKSMYIPQVVAEEFDYDTLAEKVAERLPESIPAEIAALDYDRLAITVAKNITIPAAIAEDVDYDALSEKIAEKLPEPAPAEVPELDYDRLAIMVAKNILVPSAIVEDVDYETLAEKIAERLPEAMPAEIPELDYDRLAVGVAKNIMVPTAIAEDVDYDALAEKFAERLPESVPVEVPEFDYDRLAVGVAKNIMVPSAIAEDIDYDVLAEKIAEKFPEGLAAAANGADSEAIARSVIEKLPAAAPADLDYDKLGYAVAKNIFVPEAVVESVNYDELAEKIAAAAPAEQITPDYIAAKVAEQIVVPSSAPAEVDVDYIVDRIIEKLADGIVVQTESEKEPAPAEEAKTTEYVENAAATREIIESIDSDEIADAVAKRVGTISPEEFEVTVDDDGCDSLAKAIEGKLDYDALAAAIVERISAALVGAEFGEGAIDTEELANSISEKLSVTAAVNEDALAEKAAAILSNFIPEVDNADIADKVIAGIVPALPAAAVIDSEGIADSVSERIMQNQEDSDFEIVIDDEGVSRITEGITDEMARVNEQRDGVIDERMAAVKGEYDSRLDKLESDVAESKSSSAERFDRVENSISESNSSTAERFDRVENSISESNSSTAERFDKVESSIAESNSSTAERFDKIESDIEEIKNLLLSGALVVASANSETAASDELVTVSDVVDEEVEETSETDTNDEAMEGIVEDIEEEPAEGEIMPDGIGGGVDFANMMKYNRSFIARIIQGTDEQKEYYGRVKTALLSYKKVNSNIAWGAERFNKGRETIARFKIRGKTLCLYLALNPSEYPISVYHQADVSDNKSMHGTPMMVKIKSPLGAKKAIRLIDDMLSKRDGVKRNIAERDYAAMYPYETIEELIEDGLVKDVSKK